MVKVGAGSSHRSWGVWGHIFECSMKAFNPTVATRARLTRRAHREDYQSPIAANELISGLCVGKMYKKRMLHNKSRAPNVCRTARYQLKSVKDGRQFQYPTNDSFCWQYLLAINSNCGLVYSTARHSLP